MSSQKSDVGGGYTESVNNYDRATKKKYRRSLEYKPESSNQKPSTKDVFDKPRLSKSLTRHKTSFDVSVDEPEIILPPINLSQVGTL